MIHYNKRFVRIVELFFDEPLEPALAACGQRVDIIRYRECSTEIKGTVSYTYPTIEVDLTQEPDRILAQMRQRARRKIRHACAPDGLPLFAAESGAQLRLEAFIADFDRFAAVKGIPKANRERLQSMAEFGMLDLSRAVHRQTGEVLVWHAHSVAASTARGLYSASLFRQEEAEARQTRAEEAATANCWLHWQDMLRLRNSRGVTAYDLGGWHDGANPEFLRLNSFKESFGGRLTARYYADQGVTLRGKAAVLARQIQGRLRGNR